MRLIIVSVGQRAPRWAEQALAEYQKRMPPQCALILQPLAALKRGRNADLARIAGAEGGKLLAAASVAARCIALERGGRRLDTEAVAARLRQWRQDGGDTAFLIGGPEGLPPQVLARAAECWSLSAMTLAHSLARVVLAEQLYRAHSIVEGLPYHR